MDTILTQVSASLSTPPGPVSSAEQAIAAEDAINGMNMVYPEDDADAGMVDDMVFDDTGEGQGVEGDLDKEDD